MGPGDAEIIGINDEALTRTVGFLEAYGFGCLAEADETSTSDASPQSLDNWVVFGDAATAFRDAGEWCALVDVPRAQQLFHRAGLLYTHIGLDYGWFLRATAVRGGLSLIDAPEFVERLNEYVLQSDRRADDLEPTTGSRPTLSPQQMTYLVLTAAASPQIADEFRVPLTEVVKSSILRRGVAPVGSMGIPTRRWWAIADRLLRGDDDQLLQREARYLSTVLDERVTSARSNTYTWANAAGPIAVCSVDLLGFASATDNVANRAATELFSRQMDAVEGATAVVLKHAAEYASQRVRGPQREELHDLIVKAGERGEAGDAHLADFRVQDEEWSSADADEAILEVDVDAEDEGREGPPELA